MFSSGEFIVIGLVALIVIGPERLPKVARMAGVLFGRAHRYLSAVKADINREMALEEMRRLERQVVEQVQGVEQSVNDGVRQVGEQLQSSAAVPDGVVPAASPSPAPVVPPAPEPAKTR